jgi:hypothetical protein
MTDFTVAVVVSLTIDHFSVTSITNFSSHLYCFHLKDTVLKYTLSSCQNNIFLLRTAMVKWKLICNKNMTVFFSGNNVVHKSIRHCFLTLFQPSWGK